MAERRMLGFTLTDSSGDPQVQAEMMREVRMALLHKGKEVRNEMEEQLKKMRMEVEEKEREKRRAIEDHEMEFRLMNEERVRKDEQVSSLFLVLVLLQVRGRRGEVG